MNAPRCHHPDCSAYACYGFTWQGKTLWSCLAHRDWAEARFRAVQA